jgi:two-component system, cell cycle sensor histidine kinase and response regulator CckA
MNNGHIDKDLQKKIKDLESLLEEMEELRQIRIYYNTLMQNTEDFILICDSNGVSQAFNDKYKQRGEELLNIEIKPGIQPHKLSGNPEIIKYWDSLQTRALKGEQFIAEYNDVNNSRYFETLFSPIKQGGKVTGFTEITRDITARKRIEKALQESESFNSSLLENSPTAIVAYNPDTSVRYVNPFFEKLTGYSSGDVLGIKIPYPWSVEDEKYGSIEKRQKEGVKRSERKFRKKNGEIAWSEIDVTPIYKDGELIYSLGTWIDISERKNAEQEKEKLQKQLQQAQKMEAIGNLAGGVAHDYNNISSVIMGYAELALTTVKPDDPLHGYLNHILDASKRATDITKQLLAFARKQPIAPKVLDLNDTIKSMLSMIKRLIGEDIDLAWMPGQETWSVKMDPSQVDQILVNLCVNARDAIVNVGKVTIETANVIFDEKYCTDHLGFKPGEYAMLAVSDDGIGMTHEEQEKIFEPFFTTKDFGKGTGLGLSTIYGIVKQNNGFINVYSEPGKGSTFRIYLPKEETSQSVKPIDKKVMSSSFGQGQTIMVVEDDHAILELIEMVLKKLRYHVLGTSTPKEALKLAGGYTGKIDLMVTDIILPEMNGRELAEKLCKQHTDLKVLFMSGYTANVIIHRGVLDEGINYIAKPFSIEAFAAKVKEVLET